MKKITLCIFALFALAACEPVGENADDLNSIPEEVSGL